jgi:hypothetical protein
VEASVVVVGRSLLASYGVSKPMHPCMQARERKKEVEGMEFVCVCVDDETVDVPRRAWR